MTTASDQGRLWLGEVEKDVLKQFQRSPYRDYLDEEIYTPEEIICIKIVDVQDKIERLQKDLHTFIRGRRMRSSVQAQSGIPGVSGLYIYSERATVRHAEKHLMGLLEEKEAELKAVELFLPSGYHSEHDAMHLLYRLYNCYAPVRLLPFVHRENGDVAKRTDKR